MKILRDLVLIKADKPKDKTDSGLLILEEWKSLPPTGEIIDLGPLAKMEYEYNGEMKTIKIGDRVMFDRYGSIILENDERICKSSHVMGVDL